MEETGGASTSLNFTAAGTVFSTEGTMTTPHHTTPHHTTHTHTRTTHAQTTAGGAANAPPTRKAKAKP